MNRIYLVLLTLLFMGCNQPKDRAVPGTTIISSNRTSYEVYFSPNGGCEEAVVRHIEQAGRSIRVQAYSFTSEEIAHALVRAKARGVDVQVVLDKSDLTAKDSVLDALHAGHVSVLIDSKHPIAHSKVMIFDQRITETGSYNYTEAGNRKNSENCLFIDDESLADKYTANWQIHHHHSY